MRPVHIAAFSQITSADPTTSRLDEPELVQAVVSSAREKAGLAKEDVGFWCSGSCDYVMGRPFSFVLALDGIGAWPPVRESHVEMDGAWALYEAWVRLQHGDIETAVVYAFGKGSLGKVDDVLDMQLDPYHLAPLRPGPMVLAALQARAVLRRGEWTERDFAEVVAASRRAAATNPYAIATELTDVDSLLRAPCVASPLRAHDGPVRADGAAAIVLKVGAGGPRITGIDHRIEPMDLGVRDLGWCTSAAIAAERAGVAGVDVAELHALYSPQELLLRDALGLGSSVIVNPSGGSLATDVPWVSGLIRIGEAAEAVRNGADRAVAVASMGPCLQQALVCAMEKAP